MLYQVRNGDSPAIIARRYGVSMAALIGANPRKPTTVVAGQQTWRSIAPGETVSVPMAGYLGDSASDTVNALIAAGGPCLQANAGWVCLVQKALGIAADGKWGTDTSTAARRIVPGAPAGCSPRPAWWAPAGKVNCPAVLPTLPPLPAPAPAPAPSAIPSFPSIPAIPTCAAGTFFNPLTGTCDPIPALPLQLPVPLPLQLPVPQPLPVAPPPVTPVSITCPAGTLLNPLTGSCDPIPALPLQLPPPQPAPAPAVVPAVAPQAPAPAPPAPAPAPAQPSAPAPGPAQPTVTSPTTGGVSTGTIVAGAVGAVALIGVIAAASMGGKKPRRR